MAAPVPTAVETLFGGRTRAALLGYLAQSAAGETGYAMAKELGIRVSKVYPELRRLEAIGILGTRPSPKGSKRYFLVDEDLRRFLARRSFVIVSRDWFSPERMEERRAADRQARQMTLRLSPRASGRTRRPFAEEFRRPPEKDRALKRIRRAADKAW